MEQTIGIIGVGKMGAGMWRCLANADTAAMVYDAYAPTAAAVGEAGASVADSAADLAAAVGEAGATVADSAADLAAAVDVVILSLPNSGDVEGVVDTIASALRPGV